MKIGAENSKKTYLAVGLFLLALIMVIRLVSGSSGGSSPATPTTAAATAPPPPVRTAHRTIRARSKSEKTATPVTPQLDPRLDLAALKEAEDTSYDGNGRNIFMSTEEPVIAKPVANPLLDKGNHQANNTPPPPPQTPKYTPPPINLKFFGFASGPDHKRVFLAAGDDVVVASEGEIVQRRYKIVKINNNNIEVLDVLSNNKQTIPLTAG